MVCHTNWTGTGQCPRCALNTLQTEIGQRDIGDYLARGEGVSLNHIIMTGTVEEVPHVRQDGREAIVRFRIKNVRRDYADPEKSDRMVWVDVLWITTAERKVDQRLLAGTQVTVQGALSSIRKGRGFSLSIKATEVEW